MELTIEELLALRDLFRVPPDGQTAILTTLAAIQTSVDALALDQTALKTAVSQVAKNNAAIEANRHKVADAVDAHPTT